MTCKIPKTGYTLLYIGGNITVSYQKMMGFLDDTRWKSKEGGRGFGDVGDKKKTEVSKRKRSYSPRTLVYHMSLKSNRRKWTAIRKF